MKAINIGIVSYMQSPPEFNVFLIRNYKVFVLKIPAYFKKNIYTKKLMWFLRMWSNCGCRNILHS